MNMKKVLSALLVSAMAMSLTACGGSGGSDSAADASSSAASADGTTTITIWSPTDKEAVEAWWTEKLAEWNEAHPEIQVEDT